MTKLVAAIVLAVAVSLTGAHGQQDTSPHTEHIVEINGVKLHHLDWGGDGQPLVLLTMKEFYSSLGR
jgi:hypothetical protein